MSDDDFEDFLERILTGLREAEEPTVAELCPPDGRWLLE
jgi:hypothetical protein